MASEASWGARVAQGHGRVASNRGFVGSEHDPARPTESYRRRLQAQCGEEPSMSTVDAELSLSAEELADYIEHMGPHGDDPGLQPFAMKHPSRPLTRPVGQFSYTQLRLGERSYSNQYS